MKSAKSKRQLTLLTLVVALGVAVYLNWEYAKDGTGLTLSDTPVNASTSGISVQQPDSIAAANAQTDEMLPVEDPLPNKNYGDAQLVSAGENTSEKYFEQARLTRSKTRDEALDKLQKALKAAKLSDEEKESLTKDLSAVIDSITVEGNIENMVKAKGFVDCVAFIDGEKINIAVKTGSEALNASEVAQIRDIVLSKMETEAKNITIVEVK